MLFYYTVLRLWGSTSDKTRTTITLLRYKHANNSLSKNHYIISCPVAFNQSGFIS